MKKLAIESQFTEKKKTFKIFERVKVRVETTTEFPLDIKCCLVLTDDDRAEFDKIVERQSLRKQAGDNLNSV